MGKPTFKFEFSDSDYQFTHGKKPRGFGCWQFQIGGYGVAAGLWYRALPANLTDAKQFVKAHYREVLPELFPEFREGYHVIEIKVCT